MIQYEDHDDEYETAYTPNISVQFSFVEIRGFNNVLISVFIFSSMDIIIDRDTPDGHLAHYGEG